MSLNRLLFPELNSKKQFDNSKKEIMTFDVKREKKMVKTLSDSQVNYFSTEEHKKMSQNKSFILSMTEHQFFCSRMETNKFYNEEKYQCHMCAREFPKNSNKFCSLQCYKMSKKDRNGIYHLSCKLCDTYFETKCIFTDYCSEKCFEVVTQKIQRVSTT